MTVRSDFGRSRIRSFAEAADAYVLRIQDDGGHSAGLRANVLAREVLRQLATSDRHRLVYRYSHFFSLAAAAGVDAMALCFDPPVFSKDVRRMLADADRRWLTEDGALRAPGGEGHQVYLGSIPELACFGFILTEVLGPALLERCARMPGGGPTEDAAALNRLLTSAVAAYVADTAVSEYESRLLFGLVQHLEALAGKEFSFGELTDAHVLQAWQMTAAAGGRTRFVELLARLAALAGEVWASRGQAASAAAMSIDVPGFSAPANLGSVLQAASDPAARALSEPLVVELLSIEETHIARQQLEELADLPPLWLSRARSIAFGPLEGRVIQAKREQKDLAAVACRNAPTGGHGSTIAKLERAEAKLDGFVVSAIHLLWHHDHRAEAALLALAVDEVTAEDVAVLLPLGAATPEELRTALHRSDSAACDVGALRPVLDRGRLAWQQLCRRKAFARLGGGDACPDELSDAAAQAHWLRAALVRLRQRLEPAVADCREGSGFEREYDTFCGALAQVHGFVYRRREQ